MRGLKRVTITGADDKTIAPQMAIVQMNTPGLVEWGILASPTRHGTARYPSLNWIEHMFKMSDREKMVTSLHLCGSYARTFCGIEGPEHRFPADLLARFDRVQLNVAPVLDSISIEALVTNMLPYPHQDFILQVGLGAGARFEAIHHGVFIGTEQILAPFLDVSGGLGKAGVWRYDFYKPGWRGYAGGITASNVPAVLDNIEAGIDSFVDTYWIDSESGVRTDDKLNLTKVDNLLDNVNTWLKQ